MIKGVTASFWNCGRII